MSNLELQLEQVKEEIQEVQRRVARAEYERDTAEDARNQALRNLSELGANSEQEARELLARLHEELVAELRTVQEELAAIE